MRRGLLRLRFTCALPVDAEVLRCGDGLNDGELNPAKPAGNHVVLGAGSEEILIAHLKKGSVAVTAGQRVQAGQLLGVVGNSGNSTEPHLHIHAQRDGHAVRIVFDDVRGRMAGSTRHPPLIRRRRVTTSVREPAPLRLLRW